MRTPGPWNIEQMGSEGWAVFVNRFLDKEGRYRRAFILASNLTKEDARLIAAAPELLQLAGKVEYALSRCLNDDGSWIDMPASYKRELLELARAAITKATLE